MENFIPAIDTEATIKTQGGLARWLGNQLLKIKRALIARNTLLYATNTAVGTPASTAETTLASATVPKNNLVNADSLLYVKALGTTSSSVDTKRIKVKVGATTIFDSSTFSGNGKNWKIEASIGAKTSATQSAIVIMQIAGETPLIQFTALTIDFTADVVIVLTGQNGTGNANDISLKSFSVEYSGGL